MALANRAGVRELGHPAASGSSASRRGPVTAPEILPRRSRPPRHGGARACTLGRTPAPRSWAPPDSDRRADSPRTPPATAPLAMDTNRRHAWNIARQGSAPPPAPRPPHASLSLSSRACVSATRPVGHRTSYGPPMDLLWTTEADEAPETAAGDAALPAATRAPRLPPGRPRSTEGPTPLVSAHEGRYDVSAEISSPVGGATVCVPVLLGPPRRECTSGAIPRWNQRMHPRFLLRIPPRS